MMLIRFGLMVLAVVAAAVIAVVVDLWWVGVLAVVLLIVLTAAAVMLALHYAGMPEWLGPEEEAELDRAGLVDSETGLPKRARFDRTRAEQYAQEVSRRGLVAVPDGWRGPDGAHRVLVIATARFPLETFVAALAFTAPPGDVAVLVVVPTLASTDARFRLGDAAEAVEHAERVARDIVADLRAAGMHVAGHIGPADPAVALADGLRTYDAEQVVVVRDHAGDRRYLEDVPLEPAATPFGVPLTEASAGVTSHRRD